jgi:outer membrane receptor protein involved in Fe transport
LNVGSTSDFFKDGAFQNRFEPSSNAVSTFGKHTLTYGGNYEYSQLNIINHRQNTGTIDFKTFEDFASGAVAPGSTFLQGASNRYYRGNNIGAFVQDKWQARANLSLAGGVRFDYDGPLTEKYGNLFSFDPTRYSYDFNSDIIINDGFIVAGNNKQFHTPG